MSERDRDHVIWHVRCHPDTGPDVYRHVLDLAAEFTPVVQPLPPTALVAQLRGASRVFSEDPRRLAQRFRLQAVATYGALVHVGVADTWATAATASAHAGRAGVLHLPDHRAVEAFLHPLPVDALHGIGPAQADSLRRFGLHTVGALAAMPEDVVCRLLGGRKGRLLRDRARGIDPRTITAHRMPESTSAHTAFRRDETDAASVRAAVLDLVATVGERIRRRDQVARKVTLTVGLAGGASVTRTRTLPAASGHTEDLRSAAYRILDGLALQRARVRRIVLTAEDLTAAEEGPGTQLSLDPEREARLRIEPVLDRLNARWGHPVVRPAAAYRNVS
ncbi:DNA polymerase Y family protein [Streptomyces hydrogenans]|uniref:DNA polymerase Y family protein n=1 Tax=Streptomyces hydrogenans TaxID=1873719 RepID=UPI0034214C59